MINDTFHAKSIIALGYVNECLLSLYSVSTPEMFYWMRSKLLGPETKKGDRHRSEAEPVSAHNCRRMSDCRMVAAQVLRLNTEC